MKSSAKGVAKGVKSVAQERRAQMVGKASMPWYDVRSLCHGLRLGCCFCLASVSQQQRDSTRDSKHKYLINPEP